MTIMDGHDYQLWKQQWDMKNVHVGEEGKCCECGLDVPFDKAYSASVDVDGKRHWYHGHKYCVMTTANRIAQEQKNKKKNIDHANLLKDSKEELDTKPLTFQVKKNRKPSETQEFTVSFESGHGSFVAGRTRGWNG
jgi:hypothetical protein